eukprot:958486-Alexandrium_andersonii.AAC.1
MSTLHQSGLAWQVREARMCTPIVRARSRTLALGATNAWHITARTAEGCSRTLPLASFHRR